MHDYAAEDSRTQKYKHAEHALGFETEFLCPEGLSPDKIQMLQTKNTRKTNQIIQERIMEYWQERRQNNMFDGDRARFEGVQYEDRSRQLRIFYSHEKYRTYFFTGNTTLPKPYQAQLFSINGVVITKDNAIPIGLRKPETTNQGRLWHVIPAGYIDVNPTLDEPTRTSTPGLPECWYSETPHATTERELHEELTVPEGAFNVSKMRLVGIVYNYHVNYDTTASMVGPIECDSSEIGLRGDEHERIRFVKASLKNLKEESIQLAQEPSTNSGHLRGDIALTIAHLYGFSEYIKTLKTVSMEISGETL